ncbi:hypothetical protein [Terriglobus albidus]|uniref:hypothetical protein n=1 Tax=Terriglobus albidus TaxID=1592106 RepID=UPI0021DFC061|nr:hypothetical protein [Terriglobus albidus]
MRFTANLRVEVIGMVACAEGHFWVGHFNRKALHYVEPFAKTNKNDFMDAEAITEAVTRDRQCVSFRSTQMIKNV